MAKKAVKARSKKEKEPKEKKAKVDHGKVVLAKGERLQEGIMYAKLLLQVQNMDILTNLCHDLFGDHGSFYNRKTKKGYSNVDILEWVRNDPDVRFDNKLKYLRKLCREQGIKIDDKKLYEQVLLTMTDKTSMSLETVTLQRNTLIKMEEKRKKEEKKKRKKVSEDTPEDLNTELSRLQMLMIIYENVYDSVERIRIWPYIETLKPEYVRYQDILNKDAFIKYVAENFGTGCDKCDMTDRIAIRFLDSIGSKLSESHIRDLLGEFEYHGFNIDDKNIDNIINTIFKLDFEHINDINLAEMLEIKMVRDGLFDLRMIADILYQLALQVHNLIYPQVVRETMISTYKEHIASWIGKPHALKTGIINDAYDKALVDSCYYVPGFVCKCKIGQFFQQKLECCLNNKYPNFVRIKMRSVLQERLPPLIWEYICSFMTDKEIGRFQKEWVDLFGRFVKGLENSCYRYCKYRYNPLDSCYIDGNIDEEKARAMLLTRTRDQLCDEYNITLEDIAEDLRYTLIQRGIKLESNEIAEIEKAQNCGDLINTMLIDKCLDLSGQHRHRFLNISDYFYRSSARRMLNLLDPYGPIYEGNAFKSSTSESNWDVFRGVFLTFLKDEGFRIPSNVLLFDWREFLFYSDKYLLIPDRYREILERQLENMKVKVIPLEDRLDGDEKCPKCYSMKTELLYERQTRSADEPMTRYYVCHKCQKRWTRN